MDTPNWDTSKYGIEILVAICRECLTYSTADEAGWACYGECCTLSYGMRARRMVKRWYFLDPEDLEECRVMHGVEAWEGYEFRRPRIDSAAKREIMFRESERIQKLTERLR